ncbi:hypothetical protein DID77_00370 [Candidatus Marinamargulisbacteria bacterium SCGC AG-439-L15]|nr:hypothetical protein DID77_00370 [Candidatus Marinamargulisbacteria bacterium SCGC AG-439-L15]
MSNLDEIEPSLDEGNEFSTVYGDMVTFVAVLFILLFVMVYNKQDDEVFFERVRMKMGAEQVDETQKKDKESAYLDELKTFIQDEDLSQYALVLVDEEKVRLILNDQVVFKSGTDELKASSKQVLRGFSAIIRSVNNPFVVEGHTDNIPVKSGHFDSNWDLSMNRAYAVVKFFIEEENIDPKKMSLKAYGETRPIVSNDTPANRAKNRRVELNIVRLKSMKK